MNPKINDVLAEIRHKLHQHLPEAAWGPEAPAVQHNSHLTGGPGEGEASNVDETGDVIDRYLNDIADQLVQSQGWGVHEAMGFVFDVASEVAEEGHLPEIPSDNADPEEVAMWLGKAASYGFGARVLKSARDDG